MKKIIKTYKQTFLLLGSLLIGGVVGVLLKEKASILTPFGDLFMNMMFVLLVPLLFLTITTSIASIKEPKRLGKVLKSIVLVFILTSFVALAIGIFSTYTFKLVDSPSISNILENKEEIETDTEEYTLLSRTVDTISTNDFYKLLSKENMIALVLFSILVGLAMQKVKKKAKAFENLLISLESVVLKLVDFVFYYAPIGIGCYFASLVGTLGSSIATGFLKTFLIYTVVCLFFYFLVYGFYAFLAGGKKGYIRFWKNILPVTATALATCSSAASIPVNIKCSEAIGVPKDIANTTIPLGTSLHKDGSIIGSVFKIMFLAYLFQMDIYSLENIGKILGTALVANLLVSAVPIGGGTISEMLILSFLGFPLASLPILTIIATIIDAPATLLNVTGDTASSMLVARLVEKKEWLKK